MEGVRARVLGPAAIAVDNSASGNGDIWVVERGLKRVQKFTPAGVPILVIGSEVNESGGLP